MYHSLPHMLFPSLPFPSFPCPNGPQGAELECTHPYINIGERCVLIDPWQTGNMAAVRAICKSHGGDILWLDGDTDCEFYRDLLTHIHENSKSAFVKCSSLLPPPHHDSSSHSLVSLQLSHSSI